MVGDTLYGFGIKALLSGCNDVIKHFRIQYGVIMNEIQNLMDMLSERIENIVSELHSYCDTVQIFVTIHDDKTDKTHALFKGQGNTYARVQVCEDFINGSNTILTEEDSDETVD